MLSRFTNLEDLGEIETSETSYFFSILLVQYKRMDGGEGRAGYRPQSDSSHEKEITRMKAAKFFLSTLPQITSSDANTFRLNSDPFFIKLCEARASIALDSGMVTGMYVPLALWEALLKSPAVVGPRGGIEVTWENCVRRLSNGEFTNLLRNGWIGSAQLHTEKLSEIIEAVLGSGRMLVFAATGRNSASRDYRRDHSGRFAAEDDPEGAF